MATLTAVSMTSAGIIQTLAAAGVGGDEFLNKNGKFVFLIANSSGANAYTVTVVTSGTIKGHAIADTAISVGTSETWLSGTFDTGIYNDTAAKVQLTYSGSAVATDLSIQVYALP